MSLFEPYSTEMPKQEELGARVEREHLSLSERLGYAILLSAGYAEADFVTETERDTIVARRKRLAREEAVLRAAQEDDATAGPDAENGQASANVDDFKVPPGEPTDDRAPRHSVPTKPVLREEPDAVAEDWAEGDLLEPLDPRWDVGLHLTLLDHTDLDCIGGGISEVTTAYQLPIHTGELTIALLAAEKYNRSSFQRRLESWMARLSLRTRNRLPNYSYGLAQLRPSVARAMLASEVGSDPLPDRELLALLTNTCHSARLAGLYVDSLARKFAGSGSTDRVLERIIRAYNGASSETVHGMRYVDAVRGAYALLVKRYADREHMPGQEAITCLHFSFANPEGSTDEGGGDFAFPNEVLSTLDTAKASPAAAAITYYVEQPAKEGPPLYRERMMVRRREWIRAQLDSARFSENRIQWARGAARDRLAGRCGNIGDEPWGAVEVSPARRSREVN